MRLLLLLSLPLLLLSCQSGLPSSDAMPYEPNAEFPFGRAHPDAPAELAQFSFIIGRNDCTEQRMNNATGDWVEGERTWDGHYFMNGFAIRDSGKSGASTNGNIRIYDTAAQEWAVTFFSSPSYGTGTWRGGMEDEKIVLRQAQKAPGTDFDGFSTLTFFNMSEQSFEWLGAWVSEDGSIDVPFWRVQCRKVASR